MALLWLDGFDAYGSGLGDPPTPSNIMDRRYTATSDQFLDTITGRFGEQFGYTNANTSWNMYTPNLTTNATLIAGMAWRNYQLYDLQTGQDQLIMRFRTGTTTGISLRHVGGTLRLFGVSAAYLGEFARFNIPNNRWVYIEMKAFCNDTTGYVVVRVNGTPVITVNNVDTKPTASAYLDNFYIGGFYTQFDDLYICDGSGSDNNDFIGPLKITTIRPTADSTNNFDTGSYADVDEVEIDDSTSYAETANAGTRLIMDYENISFDTIPGIGVYPCVASSVNATEETYRVVVSTGNEVESSNLTVNTTNYDTYSTANIYYDLDPDTSSAWDSTTVNSAAFGVELQ
jgi:hypothetical protein